MLKDLVVNLPLDANSAGTIDYAVWLGRIFEARLVAVAIAYEAVPEAMLVDEVPSEVIQDLQDDADDHAKAAIAKFETAARGANVSVDMRRVTSSFSGTAELFARIARRFDLAIVQQPEPGNKTPAPEILESALFDSGRPVLVTPYGFKGAVKLDRAMACWDGSRNAARALADAMPLLKKAKAVEVVVVHDDKSADHPGADIVQHLAQHGVKATVTDIVAGESNVADLLLAHAAETSADLMVMGGYGHSRLREFVMGGVTRTVLANMTIPTLMSH